MNILSSFLEELGSFWDFEVAVIDGNPITIANIAIALAVFLFGLKFSRKVSNLLVTRILARADISKNAQAALQSMIFYVLIIVFVLLSLDIAQIPIQIFAVLGGALAIGVGFGSQYVIKDFINGIILMIEQPVRVGDMIEIDSEMRGKVMKIGAISTHLLTFRNVDILVPNSALVENNVINWTLTNNKARRILKVGVAYGSDTRAVEKLLEQAAAENEKVLDDNPPKAYFVDFADNTLNFELFYWIYMNRPGDERSVSSELRHRITELFEENNITIAFPQRDVHLDTQSPLEVVVKK